MKNAEKNRDPERAQKRALSDARCAWRKMDETQREAFLIWAEADDRIKQLIKHQAVAS